ncbi:MAG: hypothetical protein LC637_06090 [Xanthomonadaceae bacterium]|nr:hypothetical protein [Xanthomonadaceae bacterium]
MAEDYFQMGPLDDGQHDEIKAMSKNELLELHMEITALNEQIEDSISQIKNSEKVRALVQKIQSAGVFGIAGALTQSGDVLPELAPAFPALQKLAKIGRLQHTITGEIIKHL